LFDELLTKRYAPGGRGPDAFDCWGLCEEVARRVGKPMLSWTNWVDKIHRAAAFESLRDEHFRRLEKPTAFCLVLFKVATRSQVYTYHVGTVLPCMKRFIHARRAGNVMISRIAGYGGHELAGYYEYEPVHS